uniref:Orn/DAP/Arg decarboxylase 2 C-terminal domain-containing protein n=1 Tax=Panagrolaimus sp. JU765 TaxID=591449 RepID=A0AC34PVA2_9BILA
MAKCINGGFDNYFSDFPNLELIAEPGSFLVHSPVSLAVNVISGVKIPKSRVTQIEKDSSEEAYMYYLNQGTYGCFNCKILDHFTPIGEPLFPDSKKDGQTYPSIIWGPSCSRFDVIETGKQIRKLENGEWMFYPTMGAYTLVTASTFNGFELPENYHFIDEESL